MLYEPYPGVTSRVRRHVIGNCSAAMLKAGRKELMSHQRSLCKCPGCPDRDTAACPYRQSENQVKELLVERKVLRETWENNARQSKGSTEQQTDNNERQCASQICTCLKMSQCLNQEKMDESRNKCPIHGSVQNSAVS